MGVDTARTLSVLRTAARIFGAGLTVADATAAELLAAADSAVGVVAATALAEVDVVPVGSAAPDADWLVAPESVTGLTEAAASVVAFAAGTVLPLPPQPANAVAAKTTSDNAADCKYLFISSSFLDRDTKLLR